MAAGGRGTPPNAEDPSTALQLASVAATPRRPETLTVP